MTDEAHAEHLPHLRRAIVLSAENARAGGHPFAALLTVDGAVVLEAVNTVAEGPDPTAHGEMVLLRRAFDQIGSDALSRATLYSSMEPCAMCAGAIYWANIPTVVYGCSARRLAEISGRRLVISCRDVLSTGQRPITIVGPLLEDEAIQPHIGFWKAGSVRGPGVYGTM